MTAYFLDREDVLTASAAALGHQPAVRDFGLLDAAIARPQSTVFGLDAYPDIFLKAAALLHSIARNHAFVDGNKRTAWGSAWVFLGVNGIRLSHGFDVDAAEAFMNSVATGDAELAFVASVLRSFTTQEEA
ncbi:death on curing protein [Plantibacter flavus]|uniref:Death-on-curing protein n=1 Tax=Plantibacter flavus TaxID=150123 RepID=A0A3N2C7Y7_9MICO|nr:type II toxin-antitoxin system death-on-curing family toxin [Plantibacter flavus]ROR83616.1 death-on-curing protein [Plantibacter flavus]SMG25392.1 death on curing protein [Plantibacter flavus]